MVKTSEELDRLKKEFESLKSKLVDLDETELQEVCGGIDIRKGIEPWQLNKEMPDNNGGYKLDKDIDLSPDWKLPDPSIQIDINGKNNTSK